MNHRRSALVLATLLVGASAFAGDLPDPRQTPGAVNPDLTPAQYRALSAHRGWTKRFRPSEAFIDKLKRKQLAAGYGGYADPDPDLYEEDHLIPLCLGGAPRDERNLWPQRWDGPWSAKRKDKLESALCRMVRRDEIDLSVAQMAIAADWIAAYNKYVKHKRRLPVAG
jgi:hypothetical protein